MGKFKLSLVAIFLISLNAFAQQPPTQGAWFDSGSVGTIYKVGRYIGGQLVFTPSLLTDNGTQLLYNGQPVGGGGGGNATVAGPASLFTCTGTNTIACTTTAAPAGGLWGNFTGTSAAPTYSTTPAFNGVNITGLNFTQLGGAASIAQVPATLVQSVGTVSGNTMLKWVASNTATNSSIVDNGTNVTTTEPFSALSVAGAATGLTAFPTGQFANPGIVSAVTSGLINELHFQEASTPVDFSTANKPPSVVGTVGLTGTLLGGMNVCSTGCAGNVAPSGYVLLDASLNTALTMQVYTCTNISTAQGITGGFFDMTIGGLLSATVPSGGTTQALGLMLLGAQGNSLVTDAPAIAKYAVAPTTFNNASLTTQSIEAVGGCHLVTWTRKASTLMDDIYVDGHLSAAYQYINTTGTAALVPTTSFALGSAPYATLSALYKHPYPIYFFNAYNRVLTAAEIQANYGAIQKFMDYRGVPNTVVPAATYSDAGNQIIAGIDSLTYGFNSESIKGWPFYTTTNAKPGAVVTANYPQANVSNIATVGYQLEQAVAECPTRGYTSINPNSATTVILWGGTNDTNVQSAAVATGLVPVTPAVAYQRLRRLVQCWKAAKPQPRVFVMTMISRGATGVAANGFGVNVGIPLETLKQQFNDLVRQDYAGADGMIDLASFPPFGANGASLVVPSGGTTPCVSTTSTTYFAGDSVHLLNCGQQTVASFVSAYLNYADAKLNATNPTTIAAATYTETSADVAINANPATASQTITLPTAVGLVGTDRYIYNIQTTGANTVTIAPAAGESINSSTSSVTCANATKCTFRSVLGTSQGVANPNSTSGAHWEIF